MSERINLGKAAPDLYNATRELARLVSETTAHAGIEQGFAHLLRLRASQINQCAYCARMHAADALTCGESNDRLALLATWRETEYFTPKERAALELLEAITLISDGQLPDEVYEHAAATLSKDELVAVSWLTITINTWNRLGIAGRLPVKP